MTDVQSKAPSLSTITSRDRVLIEGAIEMLLLFLDEMDGDADLEDEPLEQEHDGREPDEDKEASIGWSLQVDQRYLRQGDFSYDLEGDEHDGREPEQYW